MRWHDYLYGMGRGVSVYDATNDTLFTQVVNHEMNARKQAEQRVKELEAQVQRLEEEVAVRSPAAWTIQEAAEEHGPHAALAEARAVLVEAHKIQSGADHVVATAREAQAALEKQQAAVAAKYAEYLEQMRGLDRARSAYHEAERDLRNAALSMKPPAWWFPLLMLAIYLAVIGTAAAWHYSGWGF